ncbi:MAG: NAD-dependent epimerase/dehydratase family protein [Deltaproteobacteria bacterium]|nr:NAD-dependent epimerase/dehydratase family protein [Deltaproteobacteria bacterium]
MKVLVTGGAGFVGSVLTSLLLQKGHKVVVLDTLRFGADPIFSFFLHPNFEFVRADVRDKEFLSLFLTDIDIVVHLAAIVGFPACKADPKTAIETNVEGTRVIAEVVGKDTPIVFASTGSCYGAIEGRLCTEDEPLRPLSLYAQTKKEAEDYLFWRGNVVVFRFATGFGVSYRLRLDLLVNDFCYRAVNERNLVIYERHFRRSFIHVLDMARAFLFAIENFKKLKDETFNVGNESMNCSKEDIAELIKRKVDYRIYYADFGKDEDARNYEVSYEKIRKAGFETTIPLDMGVDQLISLFRGFKLESRYRNAY